LKQYAISVPWASFAVGLLALGAAWFGGEHFILRQVRMLSDTTQRFAPDEPNARTELEHADPKDVRKCAREEGTVPNDPPSAEG
jgi:hypothetical protein